MKAATVWNFPRSTARIVSGGGLLDEPVEATGGNQSRGLTGARCAMLSRLLGVSWPSSKRAFAILSTHLRPVSAKRKIEYSLTAGSRLLLCSAESFSRRFGGKDSGFLESGSGVTGVSHALLL